MNTVQKFTTFDELKSAGNETTKDYTSGLKKHNDFKEVLMNIRSAKVQQGKLVKPK